MVEMSWHHLAACFFGGVFLANFFPHFMAALSGRRFPTPFATPPFRGLSSPAVNVLWALVNLVAAYALLVLAGSFDVRSVPDVATAMAGFGLASLGLARSIGKLAAKSEVPPERGMVPDPRRR